MQNLVTVMCATLVLSACGSKGSNEKRDDPVATDESPTTEVRVDEGKEKTVRVDLSRCADPSNVTATIAVAQDPSQRIALKPRVLEYADGCHRMVELQLSGLKAGSYVVTIAGEAADGPFTYDVSVDVGPSEQQETAPTDTGSWPNEPAADIDCNGRRCDEVVGELVAILEQRGTTSLYRKLAADAGEVLATLKLDGSKFTLESSATDRVEATLAQGDFAIRGGRLALRSNDGHLAAYFRFYPLTENGAAQRLLVGKVPMAGGGTKHAYIFVD